MDVQTVDTKFFSLIFQTGLGMRIMLLLATNCYTLLLCYSVIHVQKNVVAKQHPTTTSAELSNGLMHSLVTFG